MYRCSNEPQEYTFTLTHGDGKRFQGFCRKFLPPPPRIGSKLRFPQVGVGLGWGNRKPWEDPFHLHRCLRDHAMRRLYASSQSTPGAASTSRWDTHKHAFCFPDLRMHRACVHHMAARSAHGTWTRDSRAPKCVPKCIWCMM